MKNWIKNLCLSLIIILSFNNIKGQNSLIIDSDNYNKWETSNNTCYGCGSFFIMAVNSTVPNKAGLYYYDIYLWSNSFYTNGYAATSYIKSIKIYGIDPSGKETFIIKFDYALVPPKSELFKGSFYLAYVYSTSANQIIKITWSDIVVW